MSRRKTKGDKPHVVTKSQNPAVWRKYPNFYEDYEILRLLGKGAFGKAVLVRNRNSGALYTVKMVHEMEEEMHSEIDLLLRVVDIPNVCTYFDRFQLLQNKHKKKSNNNATFAIQLDFIDGQDLKCYISHGGRVNDEIIYGFLKSSLEAIAALHEKGIVHRDVNPGNLIVCANTTTTKNGIDQDKKEISISNSKNENSSDDDDSDSDSKYKAENESELEDSDDASEEDDPPNTNEQDNSTISSSYSTPRLVLIDFGLGECLPERGEIDQQDVGTPNYYSPGLVHVAQSQIPMTRELLYANDVWGIGATMFYVCFLS